MGKLYAAPSGSKPFHRLDLNFSNGVKASLGDLGSATTTYAPTNRTRINEAGARESVGANTARIEAAGLLNEGEAIFYFINSESPATQTVDLLATKHTVELEGTGTATVAANTATITGAGAAVDGTPVTFTVTGAGTVDVTVAGSPTRVWLSNSVVATSYVITAGSSVTRTTEAGATVWTMPTSLTDTLAEALGAEIATGTLTLNTLYVITADTGSDFYAGSAVDEYFFSDGTETCDADSKVKEVTRRSQGAMVVRWTPGTDKGTSGVSEGIVGIFNNAITILGNVGSGRLRSSDASTSTYDDSTSFVAGTTYIVVIRWGFITSNIQQFEIGVLSSGSWGWGTASTYDGAFNLGTDLVIGYGNEYPFHIQGIDFWNSAKTQSFFEGRY